MNRREMLVASPLLAAAAPRPPFAEPAVAETLQRYARFGSKRSGGPGDDASGAWLDGVLTGLGFRTERQPFQAPSYDLQAATLSLGDHALPVLPQAPFRATPAQGVEGRLLRWTGSQDAAGAVAVIPLPSRRWSTFLAPEVEKPVRAALAGGAAAVVVITTGPTGEALALNIPIDAAPFGAPVVLLGSREAGALVQATERGGRARLTVVGTSGVRDAYNLIGRLDRGARSWLVVSTPRSGWTTCVGERGPGVAAWVSLAHWAAVSRLPVNVAFVCTSGHEYEYAGGRLVMRDPAPPPQETALWVHLGANVAARDWHELGAALRPLPSADPQRVLVASDRLLPLARRAFAGQPGLEAPYPTSQGVAGELEEILSAGYANVIGVFGAHRFHHAQGDDLRCVEPAHVAAAARGFREVIEAALA